MTFSRKFLALCAAAVTAAAVFITIVFYQNHTKIPAWTFAFYLDGSGSLLLEQQRNLKEIIQGSRVLRNANVVVYCDRGSNPSAPMFFGWNGPRVFQVRGGYKEILSHPVQPGLPHSVEKQRFTGLLLKGLNADDVRLFERQYTLKRGRYVLKTRGIAPDQELAMLTALRKSGYLLCLDTPELTVSAHRMSQFFSFVRDNYPAQRYAFFITGHGLGWFSGRSIQPSPEATAAQNLHKCFHADAIKKGLAYNEPDILCLDLCLMADLESLCQLQHSAGYLVMGQGPLPSGAQDYGYLFERITADRAALPDTMARSVLASSARALDKSKLNSAVALIKTGPAIDAFIADFTAMLSQAGPQRMSAILQNTDLRLPPWGGLAHEMIDLKGLIDAVRAENGQRGPDASAFLLSTHSTSRRVSGLSIYYPHNPKIFQMNRDEYASLDFTKATAGKWLELLDLQQEHRNNESP